MVLLATGYPETTNPNADCSIPFTVPAKAQEVPQNFAARNFALVGKPKTKSSDEAEAAKPQLPTVIF